MRFIKRYERELSWSIGSLFAHDDFVLKVLNVCKQLEVDPKIKYVFGSIPCLFQGGELPPRDATLENAFEIIDLYNRYGVGCRLTFSAINIEREDLLNPYANLFLKHLDKGGKTVKNGVIVSSDLLAEFIRVNYKNLQVISSIVKPSVEVGLGNDDLEYYNNLLEKFDYVIVNPFNTYNQDFLSGIKNKEKVEFSVNRRCLPNCPFAGRHYKLVSDISRSIDKKEDTKETESLLAEVISNCLKVRWEYPFAGSSLSTQEIHFLSKKGFTNFILEGRGNEDIVFARDMSDYIFEFDVFNRLAMSIMEKPV